MEAIWDQPSPSDEGVSLIVSLIMSVPAGIYSAIHQYSKGITLWSQPPFSEAAYRSFPVPAASVPVYRESGHTAIRRHDHPGNCGRRSGVAAHMVMPVLVLSVSMAGTNIRYIRSAMLEILQQDYLRTARAKGIGRRMVIYKHALRNALVPIVTVIGMQIPVLFGGAVIVEQLFSWPGLGLMTMSAILNRGITR